MLQKRLRAKQDLTLTVMPQKNKLEQYHLFLNEFDLPIVADYLPQQGLSNIRNQMCP